MTPMPLGTFSRPLKGLLWVSLGCWLCFVVDRFVYNVFEIGAPYHRASTMVLWLVLLPLAGYWTVMLRSSLLKGWRRAGRVAAFGGASFVLMVGFVYASANVFGAVVSWKGVQWW